MKKQLIKKNEKAIFTRAEFDEPSNFTQLLDACKILVASKILPKEIDTQEKAAVVILTGRELGLRMMASTRSIYVVNGKPSLSAQMMLSLAYVTRELEDVDILEEGRGENSSCTVIVKRKGKKPYRYTFSVEMAKKMQKYANEWLKQPENMCKQRAIAGNLRVTFPDAILGMYTPEEIQSIDITPKEEPEMPRAKKASQPVEAEPRLIAESQVKPATETPREKKVEAQPDQNNAATNVKQREHLRKIAAQVGYDTPEKFNNFVYIEFGIKEFEKLTVPQFGVVLKKLGAILDDQAKKKVTK